MFSSEFQLMFSRSESTQCNTDEEIIRLKDVHSERGHKTVRSRDIFNFFKFPRLSKPRLRILVALQEIAFICGCVPYCPRPRHSIMPSAQRLNQILFYDSRQTQ